MSESKDPTNKKQKQNTEVNIMAYTNIKATVDFSSLESYITKLETAKDEYQAAYVTDLYSNAIDEVKSAYGGVDCDAFVAKVEEFRNDFEKMTGVLQEYIDHLRKVLQDYRNTQENLSQLAKGLAGDVS